MLTYKVSLLKLKLTLPLKHVSGGLITFVPQFAGLSIGMITTISTHAIVLGRQ